MNNYLLILAMMIAGYILITLTLAFSVALVKKVKQLKEEKESNDEFERLQAEVKKMKENGDFHDWVQMPLPLVGSTHVCRKTGYCPTIEGFVKPEYIEAHEKSLKLKEEIDQQRDAAIGELAIELNIATERLKTIRDKLYSIDKNALMRRFANSLEGFSNEERE